MPHATTIVHVICTQKSISSEEFVMMGGNGFEYNSRKEAGRTKSGM